MSLITFDTVDRKGSVNKRAIAIGGSMIGFLLMYISGSMIGFSIIVCPCESNSAILIAIHSRG